MAPSPTSLPKPVFPMRADGQPAQDGLTMTRTVGSTCSSPTISSGHRRTIFGVVSAGPATALIAILEITKDKRPSFITTIMTGPYRRERFVGCWETRIEGHGCRVGR